MTHKEEVFSFQGPKVKMYSCGPTVYGFAHIGNFRTFVTTDLLRRAMEANHMGVIQVMNLTDVDDKTMRGAIDTKMPLRDYTDIYIKAFFEDLKSLGVEGISFFPRATDAIPSMIKMITKLIDQGYAYLAEDKSVYFRVRAFDQYGRLSQLDKQTLVIGASDRVHNDEYSKDNLCDFALWKAYDPKTDGDIFWDSPFGKGRPGWHIECSAMANDILGPSIDIHCGGIDLIFPHHENEIAQSECCHHKPFSRFWFHVEHLHVDGKKMSKSLGNFYTLRDLLDKGFTGRQVRALIAQSHYRMPLNFTFHGLSAVQSGLDRIDQCLERLADYDKDFNADFDQEAVWNEFLGYVNDDLNFPQAFRVIFDLVRELNRLMDTGQFSQKSKRAVLHLFDKMDAILKVLKKDVEQIDQSILNLVEERNKARKEKRFKDADALREQIYQLGYELEDVVNTTKVKKRY